MKASSTTEFQSFRASSYRSHRDKARKLFFLNVLLSGLGYTILLVSGVLFFHLSGIVGLLLIWPFLWFICIYQISRLKKRRVTQLLIAKGSQIRYAEEILAAGQPYAVFLRGFEKERNDLDHDYFGDESLSVQVNARRIEETIVNTLNEEVSLLTLSDPRHGAPLPGAHRFKQIPDEWEAFIQNLLNEAKVIFLHLTSFSPGIMVELNMLNRRFREGKTIIIVGKTLAEKESRLGRRLLEVLQTFSDVVFEQVYAFKRPASPESSHIQLRESTPEDEKLFSKNLQHTLVALKVNKGNGERTVEESNTPISSRSASSLDTIIKSVLWPIIWISCAYLGYIAIVIATGTKQLSDVWEDPSEFFLWWLGLICIYFFLVGAERYGDPKKRPIYSEIYSGLHKSEIEGTDKALRNSLTAQEAFDFYPLNNHTNYFRITSSLKRFGKEWYALQSSIKTAISSKPFLIIDVRDNGGGGLNIGLSLYYLFDIAFPSKIVILMNKGSMDSTEAFIHEVKQKSSKVITVGQNSGGCKKLSLNYLIHGFQVLVPDIKLTEEQDWIAKAINVLGK
ncbi:MAG: hypothetical protein EOP48_01570 [Sphingobacteriales bacterium]|nr:MAG: hypothetical protein EOP48_01570 [Sphingobacteriales bacterium]